MDAVFLQQIVNGLTIGMIYALIALGYTIVYGIAQLINFAHGEVFMVGAYFGLVAHTILSFIFPAFGTHVIFLIAVILLSMLATGLLGVTIERFAYRPLRSAPRLAPLITAIGVSFLLQNIVMLIFGPSDKSYPLMMKVKSFSLGTASITNLQIMIAVVSVSLMLGLHFFIKKTKIGKAMRALADDRQAAELIGINTDQVIAAAFLIGS